MQRTYCGTECYSRLAPDGSCQIIWTPLKKMNPGDLVTLLCGFSPEIQLTSEKWVKLNGDVCARRGELYVILEVSDGLVRLLTDRGPGWIRQKYMRRLT